MRAALIIISLIQLEKLPKVPFAKNHDMVKAIPSDRADQSLGDAVLKSSQLHLFRSMWRRPSGLHMSSIPFTGMSSRW